MRLVIYLELNDQPTEDSKWLAYPSHDLKVVPFKVFCGPTPDHAIGRMVTSDWMTDVFKKHGAIKFDVIWEDQRPPEQPEATVKRTVKSEFPDWPERLPAVPCYEDSSWHNDVCPTMESEGLKTPVKLWFGHPELSKRESDGLQYFITRGDETLLTTSDLQVMLRNAEYFLRFFTWVESGRDVTDIGSAIRDDALKGLDGRVYGGYWIARLGNGSWWTQIGRDEPSSTKLREIEAILYRFVEKERSHDN